MLKKTLTLISVQEKLRRGVVWCYDGWRTIPDAAGDITEVTSVTAVAA